jgi:hypothetical protein
MAMKSLSLTTLLLIAGWASALENSMVMQSPGGGGVYAIVQPATGNITLYTLEGNLTTRYGSANFLADLNFLTSFPEAKQNGKYYSRMRTGHEISIPTIGDLLRTPMFPDKPTAKEQAAGIKALRFRVTDAEDAFWADEKPYDGVVRGAMGSQFLLICIPIKHALLAYDCQDRVKGPILKSWRNYGVDLMVPQVYNSDPAPQAILQALPPDLQEEQKKAIAEQMEALKQGGGSVQLQPSDPWLASGSGDRWVLVDPPNKHICTYEYLGKTWTLKSSRNLEVDQLIPTSFNSSPDEQRAFLEYTNSRKKQLEALGIIPDLAYFKSLVNQKQVESGKTSEIQASIEGDNLVLDFVKLRKVYAYRLNGANNGLEFVSMRDYTLDIGFGLQDVELKEAVLAVDAWSIAKKSLSKHDEETGWMQAKFALKFDPNLYKTIEKDPAAKGLKKLPDWQSTLDEAIKASEEKNKKLEERRKAAEEERARKKGK